MAFDWRYKCTYIYFRIANTSNINVHPFCCLFARGRRQRRIDINAPFHGKISCQKRQQQHSPFDPAPWHPHPLPPQTLGFVWFLAAGRPSISLQYVCQCPTEGLTINMRLPSCSLSSACGCVCVMSVFGFERETNDRTIIMFVRACLLVCACVCVRVFSGWKAISVEGNRQLPRTNWTYRMA